MNLSFSTNRWNDFRIGDFFDLARQYKFGGIEIHSVDEIIDENVSDIYHKLLEYNLTISCIDLVTDVSADAESAKAEFAKCVDVCTKLRVPFVRMKASSEDVAAFLDYALPIAEANKIVILVETVGAYADTSRL